MQSLKNGLKNSMYQKTHLIQLTLFPPRNRLRGVGVKLSPSCFFLDKKLLFIDLKLGTHTK